MGSRPAAFREGLSDSSMQGFQHIIEVRRQRRFKVDALATAWMNKCQAKRVQHDARCGEPDQFLQTTVLPLAIGRITEQRETEKLKMNTNLVRAARVQGYFHECRRPQSFHDTVGRSRFAPGIVT